VGEIAWAEFRRSTRARRIAFLLCTLAAAVGFARGVAAATDAGREFWIEVTINGVRFPDFALLRVDGQGGLFVRGTDVSAWRLIVPGVTAKSEGTRTRVRIDNVPQLHARLDSSETRLEIEAEPALFAAQLIQGRRRASAPDDGLPVFFADYDLFGERGDTGIQNYSGHIEVGTSLGRASLASSWFATYESGVVRAATGGIDPPIWCRLDTALLLDWPEQTARLTVGDSITIPGTLGQAVRFSGIHWATDYTTQPGLIPYALPALSGTAAVPSSIELYVNQSLLERTTINPGPFELRNIPVPVGHGEVDIHMRDLLGRDRSLSVPYLVSPELLSPGLSVTDFAVGAVRENYGLASFDYKSPFLSASIQHGRTDWLTYNVSAEMRPDEFTARGGVALRVASSVTAEFTPAVSHSVDGTGTAFDAGINSLFRFGRFGIHLRNASSDFVELGSDAQYIRLHTEWAAQASTRMSRFGSLALLYGRRTSYDATTTVATTLSYNMTLREFGALSMFVSRTRGDSSDMIAGLMFTRFLGGRTTASVGVTRDNGAATVNTRVSTAAPPDSGWGWDVASTRGQTDSDGVRVQARSVFGVATGELDTTGGSKTATLAWQGGLLWATSKPWLGQTLSGPAALVELPDLSGVRVLHDGQPVGRTDDLGRILVVGLRPFEDNVITFVAEDLPLTAIVTGDSLVVRPYSRGVVQGRFPVAAAASETVVLQMDGAEPVPAGAHIALNGHIFPVGRQGLGQIPVLKEAVDAVVTWPTGSCRARLPVGHNPYVRRVAQCIRIE
jgi:outer membrane usher protein